MSAISTPAFQVLLAVGRRFEAVDRVASAIRRQPKGEARMVAECGEGAARHLESAVRPSGRTNDAVNL